MKILNKKITHDSLSGQACSGQPITIFANLPGMFFGYIAYFALCFLFFPVLAHADAGRGNVDVAQYDASRQVLVLSGWAAPESPKVYTSNVLVSVGDQQVYRGRFVRSVRPDVVIVSQRPDWLWSGWHLEINALNLLPGTHDLKVQFVLTDGDTFDIAPFGPTKSIQIPPKKSPSKKYLLLLALATVLPTLTFLFPSAVNCWTKKRWSQATMFFASVVVSFLLLVASGFTGSSVRLALKDSPLLTHDAVEWQGQARFIRMDEWNILTQMAVGQVNTSPQFPVVNRNIGIDGNNMLIIGMTGVPVSHVSALAKPATWGFWVFNLRHALAWHWWFPFFACFLALWAVLMRFFKLDWRIASVLAITIPASPYSVVFSGHPAYVVFFPVLSLWLLDRILRVENLTLAAFLGVLLGLSVAGFILVLYLPWQITLIYLLVPLGIAHFVSHKNELLFGRAQQVAILLGLAVALGLIGSWLIDTKDVLHTISATVYPGQRVTSVGGDVDRWFLIKGLLSPMTMYHETAFMNASDAGSFMWLWLPLVMACGLICWNDRKFHAVPAVIIGFGVVALSYIYIGFPKSVAELTAWGRVTSYRLDVSLGLAQLLLMAWLMSAKDRSSARTDTLTVSRIALGVGLMSAFLSVWLFRLLTVPVAQLFTSGYVWLASALLGFISYLLIEQRLAMAIYIYCVWMVGAAWSFNPIDLAPKQVSLDARLMSVFQAQGLTDNQARVAVLDMHPWRMNLVAAAIPVVNAVLYYPQPTLWNNLDPDGKYKTLYNRYQNLEFTSSELPGQISYQIDSPQLDLVRVTMDPKRFNFRQLGATHLLTSPQTALLLLSNNTIEQIATTDQWVLLRVATSI